MLEFYLAQVVNGLIVGLIYALMAVGLSLIFSVLKIVNFAHGDCYMIGGFFSYYLATLLGFHPIAAVFVGMLGVTVMWVLIHQLLLKPLYTPKVERKGEYAILMTFGTGIFLQNLAMALFGPCTKRPPDSVPGVTKLGFLFIDNNRLVVAGAGIAIMLVLLYVIGRTFIGKALRAVSQDRDAAAIVGSIRCG